MNDSVSLKWATVITVGDFVHFLLLVSFVTGGVKAKVGLVGSIELTMMVGCSDLSMIPALSIGTVNGD